MCPKPKHISSQATLDLFFVIPVIAVKRGDWLANISTNYNSKTHAASKNLATTLSVHHKHMQKTPYLGFRAIPTSHPRSSVPPLFIKFLKSSQGCKASGTASADPTPRPELWVPLSPAIQLPTCLPLLVLNIACGNKYIYCKKIVCRCPKQHKTTQRD